MEKIVKVILGLIGFVIFLTIVIWLFDIEIPIYVLSFIGMLALLSSFIAIAILIRKKVEIYEKKKISTDDKMLELCKIVKEKWRKYTGEKIAEEGTMYVTHFFKKPYYGFIFRIVSGDNIGKKIVIVTDDKGEFKKISFKPSDSDIKDPFHKFRTFCMGSPTPEVDLRMEPRPRWDLPISRGIEEEERKQKRLREISRRTSDELREILGDLGIEEE